MRMRYLLYRGRDRDGAFSFVKRIDEAPPQWPGPRLEIVGAYLDEDDAERARLVVEASRCLLRPAGVDEDTRGSVGEPEDKQ